MTPKDIFLKHQEFITAVAILKLTPQKDNVNLIEVVNAWKQELKNNNSKVIIGDCNGCGNGSLSAVKDFYVYAKQKKWIQ